MKRSLHFLLILFLSASLLAHWTPETVPDPRSRDNSHVSDPKTLLSPAEIVSLNTVLGKIESETGAQYAIVLLDSLGPDHEIQGFGVELFELWGLGQKNQNNGLLLLLVMDSRDWRFFTGYGLEPVLTDALLRQLGERLLVPHFREQRYGQGLQEISERIRVILGSEDPQGAARYNLAHESWWDGWIFSLWGIWALAFLIGLRFLFKSPKPQKTDKDPVYSVQGLGEQHSLVSPGKGMKISAWQGDRITRFVVLHVFSAAVPISAMQYGDFLSDPIFNSLTGFYLWLALVLIVTQLKRERLIPLLGSDKISRYFTLLRTNSALGFKAFFFPIPFLFVYLFHRHRLTGMKKGAFPCPACGKESPAADAAAELDQLGEKKLFEKKIGSVDHRLYVCSCSHMLEIPFPGRSASRHQPCKACGTRAVRQSGDKTITAASYSSSGTGQKEFTCRFCQNKSYSSYTIPMKTRSSSSSSSSGGGSSGGGSWGGGSTGGGGAGGKW